MLLELSNTFCDSILMEETLLGKIMHLSSYILPLMCNLNFKAVFLKLQNLLYFVYCKHDISCMNGPMGMKFAVQHGYMSL